MAGAAMMTGAATTEMDVAAGAAVTGAAEMDVGVTDAEAGMAATTVRQRATFPATAGVPAPAVPAR